MTIANCESRHEENYRPMPRRRRTPAERRAQRRQAKLVAYGLVSLGLLVGILATSLVNYITDRNRVNDYGRELRYSTYTVQAGDTMWSIAQDMAALNPEFTDIRQYLSLLQSTNHNYGDTLIAGTDIQIPYYATPSQKMRDGGSLEETIISTYARYDIIQMDRWFQILGGN